MAYTSDEIQGAVEKLVRSTIRRPYGALGERDIEATFSDVQEAIAGTYLLNGKAPFYTVFLGTRRLLTLVQTEAETVASLGAYLKALARPVTQEDPRPSLREARAALFALESAMGDRSTGFKVLSAIPAFQRFSSSVSSFLNGPAQALKDGTELTPTPDQIRELIPALVQGLKEQHAELLRRTKLLVNAIADYSSLSLSTRVVKTVVTKSRATIDGHLAALESGNAADRSKRLREVTLDVLASNALLKGLGQFTAPVEERSFSGVAYPYGDKTKPVLAGVLDTKPGPFTVLGSGTTLTCKVDGSTTTTDLNLSPSFVAQMIASVSEPYDIHTSSGTVPTTALYKIKIDGVLRSANLTTGSARTAASIATELNSLLGGYNVTFFAEGPTGSQRLGVKLNAFNTTRSLEAVDDGANAVFSFIAGYTWKCQTSTPTDVARDINSQSTQIGASTSFVENFANPARTEPVTTALIRRRTTVATTAPGTNILAFTLADPVGIKLGDVVSVQGGALDGTQWTISSIVGTAVQATNTALTAMALGSVDITISSPSSATLGTICLYEKTIRAKITKTGPYTAKFELLDDNIDNAYFVQIAVRSGPNQNTVWTLSGITSNVEISGMSPSHFDPTDDEVAEIELVDTYSIAVGDHIIVQDSQNHGTYEVRTIPGMDDHFGHYRVSPTLIATQSGDTPEPILMNVLVGKLGVTLYSKSDLTNNKLEVLASSSAFSTFFNGTTNLSTRGEARYVLLPPGLSQLEVGDRIRYYGTQYNVVDWAAEVLAIVPVGSKTLAKLSAPMPLDYTLDFGASSVPYARIADASFAGFNDFVQLAQLWLDGQNSQFFYDFDRLMNPILQNSQPSDYQTNDARNMLQLLADGLLELYSLSPALTLEYAINQFIMSPVPDVDAVLRTLREKGADRAVDVLLEGRFSDFFKMDSDDVSYAGAMMKAVRDVAREDMPVRRVNRPDRVQQRSLGSADSPDFEFDSSDVDNSPNVQIPE